MSKGNYYSGSPLGPRMSDDNGDEWLAFILALIITGILTGIVFSIKSCTDNKNKKTKTEQAIQESKMSTKAIAWNNVEKHR